ncbi:MAG TPA: apolipoprotein N-acyltransferase [Candidatus Corynebacterium gallistercoris]|uniref:Apolipoprotein N-acyltransferase n=1 Tax=Candidatus Corynebacterium gallistercoris TaxID=2838530 RepID=A0A9D1RZW8_9CORY|nr:apolipoprotein N-acyltransferase [Candidatus Corynebacterium gallistercoris]
MRGKATTILSILAAAFSGVMLFASFQPTGLWWAAPLGFGLFFFVVRPGNAMLLAWVQGLTLYGLMLPWVGEFVGAIAWIALALVQSLYILLFGFGLRYLLRLRWTALVPFWFVATELLRSSWPFGGFPWGRIAWGQVGGPLAELIRLGGPSVVTFAVVAFGISVSWLARKLVRRGLITFIGLSAVTAAAALTAPQVDGSPTVNVAAVQGNVPRLGLDFNAQRRAVLDNHVRVTEQLGQEVARGERPQPDLVIWPENSSDINPFINADADMLITRAQEAVGAPILVGTVTPEHNTMVVWDEGGPQETHEKKFLQPFGEYMPMRDLLRHVSSYVDRAGNFQPGDGDGAVAMKSPRQDTTTIVGVATCYEVSFDGAFRDSVAAGAQILTSPTNNATFGFTDMTYQQLAMSRMRALEYDRAVVVAATSGVSAIVMPGGDVVDQSHIFTPALLQADLPLRDTMTMSARVGPWVEWIASAIGVAAAIVALAMTTRTPKTKKRG